MERLALLAACFALAAACVSVPATGPGGLHVGDTIEFDYDDARPREAHVQEEPPVREGAPGDQPEQRPAIATASARPSGQDGMGWASLLRVTYTSSDHCVVAGWENGRILRAGEGAPVDLRQVTLKSVTCPHR